MTVSQVEQRGTILAFTQNSDDELDIILNHTSNMQQFAETVGFEMQDMVFNLESDIISANNQVLSVDVFESKSELKVFSNPSSVSINIQKIRNIRNRFYNNL